MKTVDTLRDQNEPPDPPAIFSKSAATGTGSRPHTSTSVKAHQPGGSSCTKSAMRTVRIPLTSYTIAVINTVPVDLTDVVSVTVDFGVKANGEVEVDSVEFTS